MYLKHQVFPTAEFYKTLTFKAIEAIQRSKPAADSELWIFIDTVLPVICDHRSATLISQYETDDAKFVSRMMDWMQRSQTCLEVLKQIGMNGEKDNAGYASNLEVDADDSVSCSSGTEQNVAETITYEPMEPTPVHVLASANMEPSDATRSPGTEPNHDDDPRYPPSSSSRSSGAITGVSYQESSPRVDFPPKEIPKDNPLLDRSSTGKRKLPPDFENKTHRATKKVQSKCKGLWYQLL
jgi:hypothetical protein